MHSTKNIPEWYGLADWPVLLSVHIMSTLRLETILLSMFLFTTSCGRGCNDVPSGLRVGGETPYVRCLSAEPPSSRQWRVGNLSLEIENRELIINGLPQSMVIAAYSGPAFSPTSPERVFQRMKKVGPHIGLMIGGLGDDLKTAIRTLDLASDLGFPTLVLAGGRDYYSHLLSAFSSLSEKQKKLVIDITALRKIRIGRETLIPVAGAGEGRYSLGPEACGFGSDDLEQISDELDTFKEERPWLISWEVPKIDGLPSVGKTTTGLDVGNEVLGEFAKDIGVFRGIFAWPTVQVMRPRIPRTEVSSTSGKANADLQVVVPRLVGPVLEREDGSRVMPGFALLRLSKRGLQLE